MCGLRVGVIRISLYSVNVSPQSSAWNFFHQHAQVTFCNGNAHHNNMSKRNTPGVYQRNAPQARNIEGDDIK